MGLDLLFHQMTGRNLDLLVFGIAFQPDDLHPVEQRLRQVEAVGGADEHHVRQIVIQFQIVVLELRVLFGIEHLKQRRGRIAAEILTELVDLIEQEQRVAAAGLLEVRNDLAGQRTDIGPAMSADFSLIAHAAERLADEFAARRLGNRFA